MAGLFTILYFNCTHTNAEGNYETRRGKNTFQPLLHTKNHTDSIPTLHKS